MTLRYEDRRFLPYAAREMFDLVKNVEAYPQFLPWCEKARVQPAGTNKLIGKLTVGFGPFRESYSSLIILNPYSSIITRSENGPFKYLRNEWHFDSRQTGVTVSCLIEYEFRSFLLGKAMGAVFNESARRMMEAFLKRAEHLYGEKAHSSLRHGSK